MLCAPQCFNPSAAEVTKEQRFMEIIFTLSCLLIAGIHWKALEEFYQMSTHLPWFQSILIFLSSFHVDPISNPVWKG